MTNKGWENKIIPNIRKIAFILAIIAIIFSLFNTLYYCYLAITTIITAREMGAGFDGTYTNFFTYVSYFGSFLWTCCYSFILIILAYFFDPAKIKPIFNKKNNIEVENNLIERSNDANGTQNGINNV